MNNSDERDYAEEQYNRRLIEEGDDGPDPFDPRTECGDIDNGACTYIEPCELRCHFRYLDGQNQPNDDYARRSR